MEALAVLQRPKSIDAPPAPSRTEPCDDAAETGHAPATEDVAEHMSSRYVTGAVLAPTAPPDHSRNCVPCGTLGAPSCRKGDPTLPEECAAFDHLKDKCIAQGCHWRGDRRADRTRTRNLTALGAFIAILILVIIGIFILRWIPARSLSTLTIERPKCDKKA